jgi:hypothetical protein
MSAMDDEMGNSNVQSNIQQFGNGNKNIQGSIQQLGRGW